jgi:hypothetical protein
MAGVRARKRLHRLLHSCANRGCVWRVSLKQIRTWVLGRVGRLWSQLAPRRSGSEIAGVAVDAVMCRKSGGVKRHTSRSVVVARRMPIAIAGPGYHGGAMGTEAVRFLVVWMASWVNSRQLEVIDFLREENRRAGYRGHPAGSSWFTLPYGLSLIPSLSNSPRTRSAPQSRPRAAMSRMRRSISASQKCEHGRDCRASVRPGRRAIVAETKREPSWSRITGCDAASGIKVKIVATDGRARQPTSVR